MSALAVALFDSSPTGSSTMRAHLFEYFGERATIVSTATLPGLQSQLSSGHRFDTIILGELPVDTQLPDVINQIKNCAPIAEIVLVTGGSGLGSPVFGMDPGRVSLLPWHQLSRLPYMLDHLRERSTRSQPTLPEIPELPGVELDHSAVISSLTADFTYVIDLDEDGTVDRRYRSKSFSALTGYSEEELGEQDLRDLIRPEDLPRYWSRVSTLLSGEPRVDEFWLQTSSGRGLWIRDYAQPIMREGSQYPVRIVGAAQNVTDERRYEMRLALQASILEMIARGVPSSSALTAITQFVEDQIPQTCCSIQVLDSLDNSLQPVIGGCLPDDYLDAIWSTPVTPDHGTCGAAAFFGELTISQDVLTDSRFQRYRDLLERAGIRTAVSMPVFNSTGDVIGTLALYLRGQRPLHDEDMALLDSAGQLAGLALDLDDRDSRRQVAEMHYQTLVEQMPSMTIMSDPSDPCTITYLSPQFEVFSARPASEILRNPDAVRHFVHPDDRSRFEEAVGHSRTTGEPLQIEFRVRRTNGSTAWLQANLKLLRDQFGVPMHWLGVMLDVTERNEAVRRLVESERRYRSLFDNNLNSIIIYDYEGRATEVNAATLRMSGYSEEELLGGPLLWTIAPEDRDRAERYFLESRAGVSMQFSITVLSKQGRRIELHVNQGPVIVDEEIVGVVSIAEDVTEQRMLESRLHHQAFHDALTGLPNRMDFEHRLKSEIERLGRSDELAILFMDLNNFKIINDSLGHDVGDRYLSMIANQLQDEIGDEAMLARLGGDEFTVLLSGSHGVVDAAAGLAKRIIETIARPIFIDGYALSSGVSIGIAATNRESPCEPRELTRRADIALYDAKRDGREGSYRVFDVGMDEWVFERLWIEGDLRQALSNGEFVIHYQPMLDLQTDEVTGVEALLRWRHPEKGLLFPDRFLRVAEETGHILEIDRWIMRTACREIADWNAVHPDCVPVQLSVNISARQFWHADFVEQVKAVLDETGFSPAYLCIEITESTMIQDSVQAEELVEELRKIGVRFAIDDFGTGYSSLSYLREFPIDILKIDREFISMLDGDEQQVGLVRAIVSMARALNLVVTAEGIESDEQLALVRSLECDMAQGFLVAPPQPFEQLMHIFKRHEFHQVRT